MIKINARRGLFRVWVIFAALFVIATGIVSSGDIRAQFDKASKEAADAKDVDVIPLLPIDCSKKRGERYDYYEMDGYCWYELPRVRALYAEYKDLNDDELCDRLYEDAGRHFNRIRPWIKVRQTAAVAIGVPLSVLVLGWSLMWALSGFRPMDKA